MFALKEYQQKALTTLDGFFYKLRTVGLDAAWLACAPLHEKNGQSWQAKYAPAALGDVPAVCVRSPTGGGKTFLAAHAVAQAGKTLRDTAAPVALWLVPSDAIRSQTLSALSTPRNPCREALTQHFGERVRVCALDDLATVGPQEVGNSAIIIVATIQAFNVKDQSIRTVYSFDESLAPHFQALTPHQESRLDRVLGGGRMLMSRQPWPNQRRPWHSNGSSADISPVAPCGVRPVISISRSCLRPTHMMRLAYRTSTAHSFDDCRAWGNPRPTLTNGTRRSRIFRKRACGRKKSNRRI